ncbi:MAG: DUF4143 domain-containing protein [Coxiellaceae bacterium]|nr:DUF4143 domain-containing protein [Coxiellaceae bacterium]
MFRTIENDLITWKDAANRKPLLVRGARQVGKSYSIEKFAKQHFELLLINFELNPNYISCFETLKPSKIISALEIICQMDIQPGKTLVFLDEVQQCPNAIRALRYFKEQMPELHVIAAGSFLEFVINDDQFQQPVGRVESLYMKPCTFLEYLIASGDNKLADYLATVTVSDGIETAIHELLIERCREYFIVGGMPESVAYYTDTKKFLGAEKIQSSILEYYRRDLSKYQAKLNTRVLEKIFTKAPALIAKHFKYKDIDSEIQARDQKPALKALIKAGILYPVYQTSANGLPLYAGINEKKFKLLFLDLGLVTHEVNVDPTTLLNEHLILLNQGDMAEQYVGQELLAYGKNYEESKLYYWARDKRGSQAEVDYIINIGKNIIPIEVKSGKTGRLKSLQVLMQEKGYKLGVRISQNQLGYERNILSIPLYMIHELPRLIKAYL